VVVAGATAVLVLIGTLEARESARQLAELPNLTRLQPTGAGLTALGALASAFIYVALGWWAGRDRTAVRIGASVGAAAGGIGGSIRAWLIAEPVTEAIGRYVAAPGSFATAALVVFVAISLVASAAAGGALAFAGVRLSRLARSRPPA
jgi:hypothetical protein